MQTCRSADAIFEVIFSLGPLLKKEVKRTKFTENYNSSSKILAIWQSLSRNQKQPLRGVLRKGCSENMQEIYRTPIPKRDFNKFALQLY